VIIDLLAHVDRSHDNDDEERAVKECEQLVTEDALQLLLGPAPALTLAEGAEEEQGDDGDLTDFETPNE